MPRVTLAHPADFDGFRAAARRLAAAGVAPEAVDWAVAGEAAPGLGFDDPADAGGAGAADGTAAAAPLAVPAWFVDLCRLVVMHADPGRFTLLYRLLVRLQHEPALRDDVLDADRVRAEGLARIVRREMHKMKAFVRFREVARGPVEPPLHVAWFEPAHAVLDAVAPFFARRFTNMPWAILTPSRSVRWDGVQLVFGPGAGRDEAPPADAGEALWLTYYEHIFNPARLKLAAMEREMPRRYWKNLPEAVLISGLSASAAERAGGMVAAEPTVPARRLPQAAMARARPSRPPPAAGVPIPVVAAGAAGGAPGAAPAPAARAAAWAAQRDAAAGCRECPIGFIGTQTVWGEGPLGAPLMWVGEQPGDQEDLAGRPFVGPAGQLLDRAFAALGWDRSLAYVTNAVKHFKHEPRGKRRIHKTPAQQEADACAHWLEAEIATVAPQALVALGATAARQLLGRPVAVTRERGRWLHGRVDGRPVLVTLHPSALLRADPATPQDREAAFAAWLDDLRAAAALATAPGLGRPADLPAPATAAGEPTAGPGPAAVTPGPAAASR